MTRRATMVWFIHFHVRLVAGLLILVRATMAQSASPASISGHVLSEEGRTLRASVTLSIAGPRGYPAPPRRVLTGVNGAFTFSRLPAGRYILCAQIAASEAAPANSPYVDKCVWGSGQTPVALAAGQQLAGIVFTAPWGAWMKVCVADPDHALPQVAAKRPAALEPDLQVILKGPDNLYRHARLVSSDSGGRNYQMAIPLKTGAIPASAQDLMSAPLHEFVETGQTDVVVRKLARATHMQGVIGFENLGGTEHGVSVTAVGGDFRTALQAVRSQDPRYKIVETNDPYVVNLLAADERSRGHEVLEFQIPKLDIEFDGSAERLVARLAEYSPPLWRRLREIYLREGGRDADWPGAVAGFSGNARLPHFSIHLTKVPVREALNAVAAQSLQISRANPVDSRRPSTPDQLVASPTGWEFRFGEPRSTPFHAWIFQIFTPLQ